MEENIPDFVVNNVLVSGPTSLGLRTPVACLTKA